VDTVEHQKMQHYLLDAKIMAHAEVAAAIDSIHMIGSV
jgi:hypothetical protein